MTDKAQHNWMIVNCLQSSGPAFLDVTQIEGFKPGAANYHTANAFVYMKSGAVHQVTDRVGDLLERYTECLLRIKD